ncbi:MAG: hypothetical protein IPK48_07035 [Gammaproteobacteria bacterium]|nr:hypothetical protein [Gammaproteobacteria bacterium]
MFVGLDAVNKNTTTPSSYRYGLMVDASGVRIFEQGVSGALLTANTPDTTLRIIRSATGQVYYHALGRSLVASPQPPIHATATVGGYGLLYSALDAVDNAAIADITLTEASVLVPVQMGLSARVQPRVAFDITLDLAIGTEPAAIMPVTLGLELHPNRAKAIDVTFPLSLTLDVFPTGFGSGTWTLPKFLWSAADYDAPGTGTWVLPRFTLSGQEQEYVPSVSDEGFWVLPPWSLWGTGLSEDWGEGAWSLPAFAMIGAEEGVEYGQGEWELILRFGMISNPPWWPEDTLMMVSWLFEAPTLAMHTDLVLVLNSHGTLTSTVALTRVQLLSLLSTMSSSTSLALSGTYALTLLGNLSVSSLQALRTLTGADLPSNAAVWVVNMDTSASAQYEDYGFNSFFRRGDDYYGVANDGIYKLEGNTDAGSPIDAFAAFVRSTLGIQSVKHVPTAYIGAASDGALVMRVDVDGIARYYKARTASDVVTNNRVDIGRGARGVYWEFELMNQNGDDFDVADITLLPVVRDRRI